MDTLPTEVPGKLLFWGVAGSRAFGLADENSDVDYKGVYVAPTENFFKFTKPEEGICKFSPDVEIDEIEKFLKLVCAGNHHHLEFLYINPQYIGNIKIYQELQRVVPHIVPRDGYFKCVRGISTKLRKSLEQIHMGNYDVTVDSKEAMHAVRILIAGERFLRTKYLQIQVPDCDKDLLLSIKHAEMSPTALLREMDSRLKLLSKAHEESILRSNPNIDKAENILSKIRRHHEFYRA